MAPNKKCSWSPRKMKQAVKAIQDGAKLRKTATLYNIPVMTLSDYVKKAGNSRSIIFNKMGRKPVFTAQQEAEIKDHILLLSKLFYGLTPNSLKRAVFEYAERNKIKNPFNKDAREAGKDWLYGFLKRNPEVSVRRPEATSINRILAFNSQEIKLYFDNLKQIMIKHKFPPHRIFNVDETGINSVHRPDKILAAKGLKQVGAATSWERGKNITICCCISATGQYIPPMIIYPRQRMPASLERGGPNGSIYKCSKSGWMNEELFLDWIKHFKEHTRSTLENEVLLILDNHSSHISLNIYQYCRENGIHMVTLPPHTSHRTQPLDLTVFGPLKSALHKECQTYMNTNNYEKLTPVDLIPLFTKAYLKIANAEKAVNGFKTAGIWPFDSNIFEQLTEEGNDEPSHEAISPEEAIHLASEVGELISPEDEVNLESEIPYEPVFPDKAVIHPDNQQPSTSGMNNARQIVENIEEEIIQTSFEAISPLPDQKKRQEKGQGKRKQHSIVLTSSPMKTFLEDKENKRIVKKENKPKKQNICKKNKKDSKKTLQKKTKKETKNFSTSSSEDEFYDEGQSGVNELCVICHEFGKDKELWYRCVSCGKWAHALCSGANSADNYVCLICE
ncbi:jerky protein homolog-like [Chrysoperla carnea]|uniref:jerky protein homolog-like n=1 Tax=Chrysoperla carnea TaxID=189513 RepID=UPI001D07A42F|nr:jerky protein homolog-like [Chrysoperla carnea]